MPNLKTVGERDGATGIEWVRIYGRCVTDDEHPKFGWKKRQVLHWALKDFVRRTIYVNNVWLGLK